MILTKETLITFGKYKGNKAIVLINDYNYASWLKNETNHEIEHELWKEIVNRKPSEGSGRVFNGHCDSTYDLSYYGEL